MNNPNTYPSFCPNTGMIRVVVPLFLFVSLLHYVIVSCHLVVHWNKDENNVINDALKKLLAELQRKLYPCI